MVLTFLDGIILYGKQSEWDNQEVQENYLPTLESSLETIRTALTPAPAQQADTSAAAADD